MMKRYSFLIASFWILFLALLGGEAAAVQIRDRCFVSTGTIGTGTMSLGAAQPGFQTFDDCGVTDSQVVRYCVEDGSNFETGFGTYTTSGATLTRTVSESTNSDTPISLTGSAKVFLCALSADIPSETTPTDTVVPGTDFFFALKDGVLKRSLVTPVDIQTMTTVGSGDSWEKPTGGQTLCFIEIWGGGGSGGKGSGGRAAAGGGGGGYASLWLPMSALASTETVTIAAGGAAQTVQLTAGNAGGTSTFGSLLTAFGGGRGGISTSDGGGGGGAGAGLFATGLNGNNSLTVPNTAVGDGGGGSGGNSGSLSGSPGATGGEGALNEGAGGGGGGAPAEGSGGGAGGGAYSGGGGGGSAAEDASPGPGAGGNSILGGDGGAGSIDSTNGVDGAQPAGGGGGAELGLSGKGGDGMARITCR
jgi:hypothetical protein